ncbi:MAG: hypothetical protein IKE76_02785 [Clostridia bacterium]|nr:hypothetical protein [Clostridia bacterium]
MINNNGCKRKGCGCMKMARGCWNSFPYYTDPCPNGDGCYPWEQDDDSDNTCEERPCRCKRCCRPCRRCGCFGHGGLCNGFFSCCLPLAVSPNGIVPLCVNNPCRESSFEVNSGLIKLENPGTYLATYKVQVPENTALDTTITLNVDGASQSAAATQVVTEAAASTASFTGQSIFQAAEGATVSLRSSEAINVTDPASQPIFTLTLVQLGE